VQAPGLADQRADRREAAREQSAARVVLGGDVARRVIPNAAICACSKVSQREQLEELELLRVRRREAGLDEVDAEASSACATRSFSSAESDIPSPCIPSRRVVVQLDG
jgi:hypothetical protein